MIKSFCKVNLFLKVLKKNNAGLHDIQTTTMLINLHDKISIKKIKKAKDIVVFSGPFKKKINSSTNTVSSAMSLLRSQSLIDFNTKYKIIINKKIPVFAGLGGGTANAATVIKYFLRNKISSKLLEVFENKIGSDLRLFFFDHSFQENLKNLKKFKKKYKFYFVLVYPKIKCSTKEIYSKVKTFSSPLRIDPSRISSKDKYDNFLKNEVNDLQKIVEKKYKRIKNILNLIKYQKNCLLSRMTGSGSVCFGIFHDRKSANFAVKVLKRKFPNYWCELTKSI